MGRREPAESIAALRERASQERARAAAWAGMTALVGLTTIDAEIGKDVKSTGLNIVAKVLGAIVTGGTAYKSVSNGLESAQTGREAAVLVAEQAQSQ